MRLGKVINTPRFRGFSLIEVLVSVVVLALGLLGLAAVFPTVVRQQRLASDGVEGASLERSVREWVANHAGLNAKTTGAINVNTGLYDSSDLRGWLTLLGEPVWSPMVNQNFSQFPTYWSYQGQWMVPNTQGGNEGINIERTTGDMLLGDAPTYDDASAQFSGGVPIPLVERLIPTPDLGAGVAPRFVFDFAGRRIDIGTQRASNPTNSTFVNFASNDDQVEIAVFVRRIDSSIRVPQGSSLANVLLNRNLAPGQRRVPVAADAANRPTNDGQGLPTGLQYSGLLLANFDLSDELSGQGVVRSNRIVFDPDAGVNQANDVLAVVGLLEQVGQKFVAPDGTVHTVRAILDTPIAGQTVRTLVIEPGLSDRVLELAATDPNALRMVVSPQVPAAVFVVRP